MRLSLTNRKAANWVDRGDSPLPAMLNVLRFFFDRHAPEDEAWLTPAVQTIHGMVEADASDVQIAGYLKSVAAEQGIEFGPKARMHSIALWHIAKAALVRDAATRLLNSDLASRPDEPPPLGEWLAERIIDGPERRG